MSKHAHLVGELPDPIIPNPRDPILESEHLRVIRGYGDGELEFHVDWDLGSLPKYKVSNEFGGLLGLEWHAEHRYHLNVRRGLMFKEEEIVSRVSRILEELRQLTTSDEVPF